MIKLILDGIIILIACINLAINCLFYVVMYLFDNNAKFHAWDYYVNTVDSIINVD